MGADISRITTRQFLSFGHHHHHAALSPTITNGKTTKWFACFRECFLSILSSPSSLLDYLCHLAGTHAILYLISVDSFDISSSKLLSVSRSSKRTIRVAYDYRASLKRYFSLFNRMSMQYEMKRIRF